MENSTTTFLNRPLKLMVVLLLFVSGCVSYTDNITNWYFTTDEQEKWLADSTLTSFQMIDQHGITREYVSWESDHYFLGGSSYFAGIKYQESQREYYYQRYRSNYGDNYYFDIDASYQDGATGPSMTFDLNGTSFEFDFSLNEITRLGIADTSKWLRINSEGINDELFKSTVSFVSDYSFNDVVLSEVFVFELKDFHDNWDERTMTKLVYAQNSGILYYKMNNGLEFQRINLPR